MPCTKNTGIFMYESYKMTENSVRNCPFFFNFTPIKKYQNFEIFVGTISYAPGTIIFSRNDYSRMSAKM